MTLEAGTRLGPYEILAPLGAGGMGEVYQAKDTRLDRTVAVKVLPEHLSASDELRQRLEREARTVSQLSHPHICALYDVGHQDGTDYLVMEYLEGETLSERLAKGALLPEQTLRYGIEMADALESAHRAGVIHRDLKPGNVMLTRSGVKLLDFGLAKLHAMGGPNVLSGMSRLATEASPSAPLTERGTILGTFQYMSPEQLEGKEADARSDIFAFGCVLYEMATGKKAFSGKSQASLIGSILKEEPPAVSQVAPMTPPALDRVVKTCLSKDPEDRFQTAHDVRLQLQWIAEGGSQAGVPAPVAARRKSREKLAWSFAGVLFVAAAALGVGFLLRAPKPSEVLRATLDLPPGARLDPQNASVAISPDGSRLAMALRDSSAKQQIWVRPLDSLTAQPLAGTEGATYPFWSPDGRSIGFFADGKLKKIESSGGAVQTICDAADGRGAAWNRDGVIVFAGGAYGRLSRVSAAGGTPAAIGPEAGPNESHRLPRFLPDGSHLLFYSFEAKADDSGVSVLDLKTGRWKALFKSPSEARYVPPGYLVFIRENNLLAQPFNAGKLATTGEAVPIAENVEFNPLRATGNFALAGSRLLVYETGGSASKEQLTWVGLDGKKLGTVGEPGNLAQVSVSPDGRRAAVGISGANGNEHLWIMDLGSGVRTRFTLEDDDCEDPIWSPDGRSIAYTQAGPTSRLVVKDSSGGAAPTVLFESSNYLRASDWSPDGKTILFTIQTPETKSMDIWQVETEGAHKAKALVAGPRNEQDAHVSPDGKWLAYRSDEDGQPELYIAAYPGPGGKWQITSSGAGGFDWLSPQDIIYGGPQGPQAVTVTPRGSGLDIGAPRPILGGEPVRGAVSWDRKSRRILEALPVGAQAVPSLRVVTNWTQALNAK
jgi:eukaryotic-like serine/threonine-protein kinase